MPKKPSDFLNKKRSRGNGDFARPKAKVGRKVKRRAGETDASFRRGSCPSNPQQHTC